MRFLRFGLDVPTSKRIWILILIGLISFVYFPMSYAMFVYYAYFRAWDITSTTDLKLKFTKSLMEFTGLMLGLSIIFTIMPETINMLLDSRMAKILIQYLIVYQSSVIFFLYIHHFGLHPRKLRKLNSTKTAD